MFVCGWFGYGLVCGFVDGAFTLIVLVYYVCGCFGSSMLFFGCS